jgi:Fur family ferric uptake transcriptional regulator
MDPNELVEIAERLFVRFLRSSQQKVTQQRLATLQVLFANDDYIDADELLIRLRQGGLQASRATVYRTLELLVESGLVRLERFGRRAVYRRAQPGKIQGQLVCTKCDTVVDFDAPPPRQILPATIALHRFEAFGMTLRIEGHCRDCRAQSDEAS